MEGLSEESDRQARLKEEIALLIDRFRTPKDTISIEQVTENCHARSTGEAERILREVVQGELEVVD